MAEEPTGPIRKLVRSLDPRKGEQGPSSGNISPAKEDAVADDNGATQPASGAPRRTLYPDPDASGLPTETVASESDDQTAPGLPPEAGVIGLHPREGAAGGSRSARKGTESRSAETPPPTEGLDQRRSTFSEERASGPPPLGSRSTTRNVSRGKRSSSESKLQTRFLSALSRRSSRAAKTFFREFKNFPHLPGPYKKADEAARAFLGAALSPDFQVGQDGINLDALFDEKFGKLYKTTSGALTRTAIRRAVSDQVKQMAHDLKQSTWSASPLDGGKGNIKEREGRIRRVLQIEAWSKDLVLENVPGGRGHMDEMRNEAAQEMRNGQPEESASRSTQPQSSESANRTERQQAPDVKKIDWDTDPDSIRSGFEKILAEGQFLDSSDPEQAREIAELHYGRAWAAWRELEKGGVDPKREEYLLRVKEENIRAGMRWDPDREKLGTKESAERTRLQVQAERKFVKETPKDDLRANVEIELLETDAVISARVLANGGTPQTIYQRLIAETKAKSTNPDNMDDPAVSGVTRVSQIIEQATKDQLKQGVGAVRTSSGIVLADRPSLSTDQEREIGVALKSLQKVLPANELRELLGAINKTASVSSEMGRSFVDAAGINPPPAREQKDAKEPVSLS
jgi:hypothetical protein